MNVFEWSLFLYFFFYVINYGFDKFFFYKIEKNINLYKVKGSIFAKILFPLTCAFCFAGWISIFYQFFNFDLLLLGSAPLCFIIDYIVKKSSII